MATVDLDALAAELRAESFSDYIIDALTEDAILLDIIRRHLAPAPVAPDALRDSLIRCFESYFAGGVPLGYFSSSDLASRVLAVLPRVDMDAVMAMVERYGEAIEVALVERTKVSRETADQQLAAIRSLIEGRVVPADGVALPRASVAAALAALDSSATQFRLVGNHDAANSRAADAAAIRAALGGGA